MGLLGLASHRCLVGIDWSVFHSMLIVARRRAGSIEFHLGLGLLHYFGFGMPLLNCLSLMLLMGWWEILWYSWVCIGLVVLVGIYMSRHLYLLMGCNSWPLEMYSLGFGIYRNRRLV